MKKNDILAGIYDSDSSSDSDNSDEIENVDDVVVDIGKIFVKQDGPGKKAIERTDDDISE